MKSILKWWLIFCLTLLGMCTCVYFNIHKDLYAADVTRLSFLIISIFTCTSIWIGTKTYKVGIQQDYNQKSDVGWFISESCLALGMVGTVTGFLIMLGTAFANVDVTNSALRSKSCFFASGLIRRNAIMKRNANPTRILKSRSVKPMVDLYFSLFI